MQEDREAVAPVVVRLLGAVSEACPVGSAAGQPGARVGGVPPAVLAKEAVYNAAGVGAYDLHDYISFGSWYHASLLPVRAHMLRLSDHLFGALLIAYLRYVRAIAVMSTRLSRDY